MIIDESRAVPALRVLLEPAGEEWLVNSFREAPTDPV